ncbi:MAG: molybdenum cofactor biosynthesis protein MoaE [Actinomycetota bacterium]|nr:molybdenum cofactor biosynthesis protein MoaE [Actinomycetota bacterium]
MAETGSPRSLRCDITEGSLDVPAAIDEVAGPSCGGLAVFVGTVRESAAAPEGSGRPVVRLEYDAHPQLAKRRLEEIGEEALRRWDVKKLVAVHRSGACALGEPTVVVACSAPHRGDALEACRFVIDTIKSTVPIWKREVYADGSSWVGAEGAGDAHG